VKSLPFIVAFFALTILPLMADSFSFSADVSTNTANIGDRIILTVKATHEAGEQIAVPSIERDPFILVWDIQTESREGNEKQIETITRFIFSSFVIGEHRISTNPVTRVKADGTEEKVPFPELLINIVSVLSNPPPTLADIKPSATLPGQPWLRTLVIIVAVIVLTCITALIIRHALKRKPAPQKIHHLPPHDIALSALNALRARGHIEKGEFVPFYVELSAIVRLYLEQRFDLHAPEQTTEEFIRSSTQSSALSPEHRLLTQSFLEQSDLVKFARFEPGSDDMTSAWEAAAKLVRETIAPPTINSGGAS
jgi:hypothetical protein